MMKKRKEQCRSNCGDCGCINVDSYTEQRFFELCSCNDDKIKIFYEWQTNKERYIKTTDTTVYDFQNYSLHDKTHSQTIIISVEKFLGRDRIDCLGIGDLWMLLNAAYGHDVGMAVKHEEVLRLWESDPEFQRYIERQANCPELYMQKEARFYLQLHNLLNNQEQMKALKGDKHKIYELTRGWPVHMKKNVMLLTNEYIRMKHAKRSEDFIEKFSTATGIEAAENRLYKLLARIAYSHNEDFSYVLDLPKKADGFCDDRIHPRFIAAMLRLGDLLDMDNNRFDYFVLEHFGELPEMSRSHLKKHLALTHLLVTERKIEATEETEDELTGRLSLKWFEMIENEVKNITSNWNRIAPGNLGGCTFNRCNLKVFLNGNLYTRKLRDSFTVDKKKFMDILIGDKLYDDSLVFLREYIQNAMDATKMMLNIRLRNEWARNAYRHKSENYNDEMPLELNSDYLEELALEIRMEIIGDIRKGEEEAIRLTFVDHGIGMEEDCIDVIAVIGTGWSGRKKFRNNLNDMKCWLYPTGGFGVGLQSGFMIADKVRIETLGYQESWEHVITLNSPRNGGEISVIKRNALKSNSGNVQGNGGTKVSLDIVKENFSVIVCKTVLEDGELSHVDPRRFLDNEELMKLLLEKLEKYISNTIPDCLFPIIIRGFWNHEVKWEKRVEGKLFSVLKETPEYLYDEKLGCAYTWKENEKSEGGGRKLCFWDYSDKFYGEIDARNIMSADQICFRGIAVREFMEEQEQCQSKVISRGINVFLDFMNAEAEEWLLVSRSGFRPEARNFVRKQALKVFWLYIRALIRDYSACLSREEFAAIFKSIVVLKSEWDLETEFGAKVGGIQTEAILYQKEEQNFVYMQGEDVSPALLYQIVSREQAFMWKTSPKEDDDIDQELILDNTVKSYSPDESGGEVDLFLKEGFLGAQHKVILIRDRLIMSWLDSYDIKKYCAKRCYVRLVDNSGKINQIVGYMKFGQKKTEKKDIKTLLREAITGDLGYLTLDIPDGFDAICVKKLPQDNSMNAYCEAYYVLLLPFVKISFDSEVELAKKCKKEGNIYSWDDFWKRIQDLDIWAYVIDWTVRYPKNNSAHFNQEEIIRQYRKLCTLVFEIIMETC